MKHAALPIAACDSGPEVSARNATAGMSRKMRVDARCVGDCDGTESA